MQRRVQVLGGDARTGKRRELGDRPALGVLPRQLERDGALAREGHVNTKGMPSPLQLALTAVEFSDVIVFRKPPPRMQRVVFGALAPIARGRGYRATYPSLSRTTLAPRSGHAAG